MPLNIAIIHIIYKKNGCKLSPVSLYPQNLDIFWRMPKYPYFCRAFENMENQRENRIISNFRNVKFRQSIPAFVILFVTGLVFLCLGGSFLENYTHVQIPLFKKINHALSIMPGLEWNLTEAGNALIGISLLAPLLYFAPAIWGAMFDSLLIALGLTELLKTIFSMPRPAAVIDRADFTIIGPTLTANSLPSGHSITLFVFITVLIIAFFPQVKARWKKEVWVAGMVAGMFFVALSRVACGAHWPLDVLTGSATGCIFAISGILLDRKFPIWKWMTKDKFTPVLLGMAVLLLVLMVSYITGHKIQPVYLLAVLSIIITIVCLTRKQISSRKAR